MKALFSIPFLREEQELKSVEDQIKHAHAAAKAEMREIMTEEAIKAKKTVRLLVSYL